ncbi:MAG: hypothetical protein NDI94_03350 [Candidatus Woesearchaeota archaeon]|nr:hypothetical protein [Candidatus Woesearchaeota archaeon]
MLLKDILDISADEERALAAPENRFYSSAYDFASSYGVSFAKFVLQDISRTGKTNIAVCLNGAEHLGTMVEFYLDMLRIENVDVHYVYLTEKIAAPWKLILDNSIDGNILQVGYGTLPRRETYATSFVSPQAPNNTIFDISEYLRQIGIFECDKLSVLDTGYLGSIPEVISRIAGRLSFRGLIEGVLLKYAGDEKVKNHTLPIRGYNIGLHIREQQEIYRWAYLIDSGIFPEDELFEGNDSSMEKGFRKSRESPSKLILQEDKSYVPDTPLFQEGHLIRQYKSTLLGIRDGLASNLLKM